MEAPGSWHDGSFGAPSRVVVMKGETTLRASYGSTVQRVLKEDPRTVVMIDSLIGLVPYLEDLSRGVGSRDPTYIPLIPRMQTTA